MFTFLLVVQGIIAAALVSIILMQQSEGGGLGVGGSPSGLMSARGAADFLTRATSILAGVFIILSIVLAVMAATRHSGGSIDTSLDRQIPVSGGQQPAAPASGADPLAAAASSAANNAAANNAASNSNSSSDSVPLAQ